jgi:hypothetical protein
LRRTSVILSLIARLGRPHAGCLSSWTARSTASTEKHGVNCGVFGSDLVMTDDELAKLVVELSADGIVVTREEASRAVRRLAELLLLISEPLPLLPDPGSTSQAAEDRSPAQDGLPHGRV